MYLEKIMAVAIATMKSTRKNGRVNVPIEAKGVSQFCFDYGTKNESNKHRRSRPLVAFHQQSQYRTNQDDADDRYVGAALKGSQERYRDNDEAENRVWDFR
jgi:hypothetical protein